MVFGTNNSTAAFNHAAINATDSDQSGVVTAVIHWLSGATTTDLRLKAFGIRMNSATKEERKLLPTAAEPLDRNKPDVGSGGKERESSSHSPTTNY